ncbi:MAG: hypothetical protein EXS03_05490 [Phycisphaerales bacterium]|nr:hypothetical protein [Phycisphaerales bacterium]
MSQDQLSKLPNPRVSIDDRCARFRFVGGNPLDPQWRTASGFDCLLATHDRSNPTTFLVWSGTLGLGLFDPAIGNWMRPGREALAALVIDLLGVTRAAGASIGFIPHHAHLLSDVAGQMRHWHEHSEAGLVTVLSPASLIAGSMRKDLDDHLRRAIEMCAPRCAICVLEDLRFDGTPPSAPVRVPWLQGEILRDSVVQMLTEHLPVHTPIAVPSTALSK